MIKVCNKCGSDKIIYNGYSLTGARRQRCKNCNKSWCVENNTTSSIIPSDKRISKLLNIITIIKSINNRKRLK